MRSKRLLSIILIIVCIGMCFACAKEKPTTKENTTEKQDKEKKEDTDGIINIDEEKLPYTEEEIFDQLFDINNFIQINLDISNEELAKIQEDYEEYSEMGSKSPIYRKADLEIIIKTETDERTYLIEDVGVRMKGNTSRTDFYNEEEGQYNLIHFKIDFQETFDDKDYYDKPIDWSKDEDGRKERKDRTFATLENIELRWNKCDDSTYIREYMAYEFYREMGLLAQHSNLASTDVAGVHQGVFMIYEPIDKVFIEKYVDEKDQGGDLYKAGWTWNGADLTNKSSVGIEDEDVPEFYNYDLKTNKKTSDLESMKNLIRKLGKSNISKEEIAELVDMDYFVKYEAVSYFVGDPDDARNNYNNHYVYFLKSSGKAIFIPCDLDRTFGITKSYNPSGDAMVSISPYSKRAMGTGGEQQRNPLYIKTVCRGGYYVDEYTKALEAAFSTKTFTFKKFEEIYNIAKRNYSSKVIPSKEFYNAEGRNYAFSLERSEGINTDSGNASVEEYLRLKKEYFLGYLEEQK